MSKALDAINEQIISLFRADARLPLSTLARQVGLSRSAAQERLQRLEQSGVIVGYTIRYRRPLAEVVRTWMFVTFGPGITCTDVVRRDPHRADPGGALRGSRRLGLSMVRPRRWRSGASAIGAMLGACILG